MNNQINNPRKPRKVSRERVLTVGQMQIDREGRSLPAPMIRVIGKFLRECGFEPGMKIDVKAVPNKIIITPHKEKRDAE